MKTRTSKRRRLAFHKVIADYQSGMSYAEMEQKYMVSYPTILRLLKDYNIEIRKRGCPKGSRKPIRDKRICEMYLKGFSLREVGIYFDVSHERIRQILNRAEIVLRPQGKKTKKKDRTNIHPYTF
tara:strand:- start:446 stop:820 length:375 start_codon:yes stop_codon:yes gene_type:complete